MLEGVSAVNLLQLPSFLSNLSGSIAYCFDFLTGLRFFFETLHFFAEFQQNFKFKNKVSFYFIQLSISFVRIKGKYIVALKSPGYR